MVMVHTGLCFRLLHAANLWGHVWGCFAPKIRPRSSWAQVSRGCAAAQWRIKSFASGRRALPRVAPLGAKTYARAWE